MSRVSRVLRWLALIAPVFIFENAIGQDTAYPRLPPYKRGDFEAVEKTLEEGFAAYKRGDYATAKRILTPYATQGNQYAQVHLGEIFSKGQGTVQDYNEATKWYQLSANQGNTQALLALSEIKWLIAQNEVAPVKVRPSSEWVYVTATGDGDVSYYFSPKTTKVKGEIIMAWLLTNGAKPRVAKTNRGFNKQYLSAKELWGFRCADGESAVFEQVCYEKPFGGGDVADSWTFTAPNFSAVVPESVGETLLETVCTATKKRAK